MFLILDSSATYSLYTDNIEEKKLHIFWGISIIESHPLEIPWLICVFYWKNILCDVKIK